ncbi:hypothetical protein INR49_010966, partial [Caranx melampygus]
MSRSVQILDPGVPSFGVGIRVVEEPAPAGKARRWRWTPEHKLQPEPEPDRRCRILGERVLGVTGSRHGVCAFTSSSYSRSSSCSRIEETDILPFADRMKFFEETSKGMSGSHVSSLSSRRQKKPPNHSEHQGGEVGLHPSQRRYSYQGGLQQQPDTMEARRQSVSTSRERQREKEREERARAREWEERLREMERQQEKERQERELEMERAKLREIQREKEREERVRQWERERERELELEREKEMERAREKERLQAERERELQREREKERVENSQLNSHQEFYGNCGIKENHQDFQPEPQAFSHSQTQNQVPRSAFYPINAPSQHLGNHPPQQQGYMTRSYTPTETYPARQQETTKLNRKYSLTERYPSWRRESRPPDTSPQHHHHLHHGRWGGSDHNGYTFAPPPAPLALRGRAMSENDLRFDGSHRWSPSISVATSQTLSEVEEGGGQAARSSSSSRAGRRRHLRRDRRRQSGSSSTADGRLTTPCSPPPPRPSPHPSLRQWGGTPPVPLALLHPLAETSRQRSTASPQEEGGGESCPRCTCHHTHTPEQPYAHHTPPPPQPGSAPGAAAAAAALHRRSAQPMFSSGRLDRWPRPQGTERGPTGARYGSQQEREEV